MKKQKSEKDILLENLAEAILEYHKNASKAVQDPFDHYIERVQAGFFSDEKRFLHRFVNGYHILENALKKNE